MLNGADELNEIWVGMEPSDWKLAFFLCLFNEPW